MTMCNVNLENIVIFFGIILLGTDGCTFYDTNGIETELESTKYIRLREDMSIGDEVLSFQAYPRNMIFINGTSESPDDKRYFQLKEINNTNVQVLLDESIDDLVDQDVPKNVLKFKIECMRKRNGERLYNQISINVYIEDVNDHAPKWHNAPYQIYVDEATPIGTKIFTEIFANDRDQPNTPNSDVQYSIQMNNHEPGGAHFALESPHRPHVILRRQLDFDEGKRMYEIPIVATDRGDKARSSSTTLMIMVKDSDDLPPKFTESIYRTKINEFPKLTGQSIKMPINFSPPIMAYDQDSLNTSLIYDIISGNDRNLFWINQNTGVIHLLQEIDLETETLTGNTFVLQVEARQRDSPIKRALSRIEIEIVDLNDNRPEFEVDFYNISIVENLPSGFSVLQVNAIDRDQGENADFIFVISEESPEGAFLIDQRTGWITVRDQELLDREARNKIAMTVQAIEKIEPYGDANQEPSSVQIEIMLLDANDNTPQFDLGNLYEFKASQNAPVGHIIGFITAKDTDEGRNGMILYDLKPPKGTGSVPLRLDSKTGALMVSGSLKKGKIAIFVEASDQPANPSERRFSLAVVTVDVVPKFDDASLNFIGAPYEFWVGSNAPIGYSVGHIKTNLDWNTQNEVMYDLLHSYSEGVPFAVEERSGVVTVISDLKTFDRTLYEFEAVAAYFTPDESRSNKPLLKRTSKSVRQITKTGDVFELEQGVVTENENILITNVTVHVVNPDEEKGLLIRGTPNDPIEFRVSENVADALIGQLFYKNISREGHSLKKTSPTPVLTKGSDSLANRQERFLNSRFSKTKTKMHKSSTETKRLNRQINFDQQFYVPVAPSVFYDKSVAVKSEIFPLRRSFLPKMTMNSTSIRQNINSDSERTSTLNSSMMITDIQNTSIDDLLDKMMKKGMNGSQTPMSKVILVTPRPIRNFQQMNARMAEASKTMQDKDKKRSGKQMNSDQLNTNGLKFVIANQLDVKDMICITNDGTLMTSKALDREERDVYRLTVILEYYQGHISGAGIFQVVIYVDDVNDNPPLFNLHSYSGSMFENAPVGTEIILDQRMLVHDMDINENAVFDLTIRGEGSNFFTLEKKNVTHQLENLATSYAIGNQRFARALSKTSLYHKSNASESSSSKNIFNFPHYVIKYIGPNIIDREIQNYYEFTVVAKDTGGLSSEAKLNLYIKDVNDNAPIFENIIVFKETGIEIQEFPKNIDVYFSDRMTPDTLTYPIKQHSMYNADSLISSSSNVNYEIMQLAEGSHIGTPRQMNVTKNKHKAVKDHSQLGRSRSHRKHNDNSVPTFSIFENVEVGKPLIKVKAVDDDYEENAQVYYQIVSETYTAPRTAPKRMFSSKNFGIDSASGEIRLYRQLPAQTELILNVTARDNGGLSDNIQLKFKVFDINDHAPAFEKPWYTFDISEGEYKNIVLGKITATDEDYGDNANITYTLISNDLHPFYVLPLTGILKINGQLDRETKSLYELKIVANDNSKFDKRMTSTAGIEVNILDVNDNAPLFIGYDEILALHGGMQGRKINNADDIIDSINGDGIPYNLPVYKAYLNRNTEPGTYVKQITAIDKDFSGNGNGLVMYALRHNSLPYFFEIDSRDGVIMTIAKFSRYHGYEHINLTIIASDLGTPSKSSVALLIVNLQGDEIYEHDYEDGGNSLFQHKYYEIEVPENNVVPTMLLQINATDPNGRSLKWSISSEQGKTPVFHIDPINGTLWLVRSLDREFEDTYRFKVRADSVVREGRNLASITYPISDERVSGLLENEVRIVVRVTDENDNAPKFTSNGKPIVAVVPNTANFGYPIAKVEATDDDVGFNAEIRYNLLNEPTKLFEIDEMSGSIRVLGPVNAGQRVYGFDVKATDRKGADDGKSTIVNVFVYVLENNRQVRLLLAGAPIEIEKGIKTLTNSLSDLSGLDVRVRMIEPHFGDNYQPATDVYLYAVDPETNTIVDMEILQSAMTAISMGNVTTSARILGLAELGEYQSINSRIPHTNYSDSSVRSSGLPTIILASIFLVGGLMTTFCIVCVRYRRVDHNGRRQRDYIDVSSPQSALNSNFNLIDHENRCVKYNPLQYQNQVINNADTSVPSIHSSGCDSGVGLTAQLNDASIKQVIKLMPDLPRRTGRSNILMNNKRNKSCVCGYTATGIHVCSEGDESSDSYEDSLKNASCLGITQHRTSFPHGSRHSIRSRQLPLEPM